MGRKIGLLKWVGESEHTSFGKYNGGEGVPSSEWGRKVLGNEVGFKEKSRGDKLSNSTNF